jgi:hypothetical protein
LHLLTFSGASGRRNTENNASSGSSIKTNSSLSHQFDNSHTQFNFSSMEQRAQYTDVEFDKKASENDPGLAFLVGG